MSKSYYSFLAFMWMMCTFRYLLRKIMMMMMMTMAIIMYCDLNRRSTFHGLIDVSVAKVD